MEVLSAPGIIAAVERAYHGRLWTYACIPTDTTWRIGVCHAEPLQADAVLIDQHLHAELNDKQTALVYVDKLNDNRGITRHMRLRILAGRVSAEQARRWTQHIDEVVAVALRSSAPAADLV